MTELPVKGTLLLGPHEGYQGSIEYDSDDKIFHGQVVGTRDVIAFEGETIAELTKSFKSSVDAYLKVCKSRGEKPEKPFSGKLLLRMSPELHRRLADTAMQSRQSLNSYVCGILETQTMPASFIAGVGGIGSLRIKTIGHRTFSHVLTSVPRVARGHVPIHKSQTLFVTDFRDDFEVRTNVAAMLPTMALNPYTIPPAEMSGRFAELRQGIAV